MFAVTGIPEKLGQRARSLLSEISVSGRSQGSQQEVPPGHSLGCDIAVADLSDTEALTAAFAGTAGVFAMVPPVFDPARAFPKPWLH